MTTDVPPYEARFYERAAQRHVARLFPGVVCLNVRWGLLGSLATRNELDALIFRARRAVPVEIKAHVLDRDNARDVMEKYRDLGFSQLVLVAPAATREAEKELARGQAPSIEFVRFQPNLDAIRDWYATAWPKLVPSWTCAALETGRHHLRFILSQPTSRGQFVIGQQRTRVYSPETVLRLIARLPTPPARILWTAQRFTTPRDLIARGSRVTSLGGFVPVDIDGDKLHQANYACQISAGKPTCAFCRRYAEVEYKALAQRIDATPIDVLASGGRGVHVYYHDAGNVRDQIVTLAREGVVCLDENVTVSQKSTVALPGSLHAGSGQPVTSMMNPPREVALCS